MSTYANADGTSRETGLYAGADGAVRALFDKDLIHDMDAVSIASGTDISEFSFVFFYGTLITDSGFMMALCVFPQQNLCYSGKSGSMTVTGSLVMSKESIELKFNGFSTKSSVSYDSAAHIITFSRGTCVGWR